MNCGPTRPCPPHSSTGSVACTHQSRHRKNRPSALSRRRTPNALRSRTSASVASRQTADPGLLRRPAIGDANRLFRGPPFPPPAQRCALTCVLSSAACSGGSGETATVSKICCQSPRPLQRLKRLYTVVYGPYSGGQSCQRHPVFSTWMIPLKIRRLFCGFGPGRFVGIEA
jgi:hypothetical protein